MSDELHAPDEDLGADTERFRRFARRDGADGADTAGPNRKAVGAPFRLATLLVGIGVLALIVWLLFQM